MRQSFSVYTGTPNVVKRRRSFSPESAKTWEKNVQVLLYERTLSVGTVYVVQVVYEEKQNRHV